MAEKINAASERPLHGDWVHGVRLGTLVGERVLKRRDSYKIHGGYDRVCAAPDPEYPGINIIELFEATPDVFKREPVPLEYAIDRDPHPARFLLSLACDGLVVVTSRMGHTTSGQVIVLPGDSMSSGPAVDMYDYSQRITDPRELRFLHISRLLLFGGEPENELLQESADAAFRNILSRAPQIR